jgi:hypothetical protein
MEAFILAMRPAGSPCLANPGLGDTLYGAEAIPFLVEDRYTLLNGV